MITLAKQVDIYKISIRLTEALAAKRMPVF